jgi:SAM-dependent methyltransferase
MAARRKIGVSHLLVRPADPTERFSSRARDYVRFRPSYPDEVLNTLTEECTLSPDSLVADIGSGTGVFTRLLLENGNRVFAVEPNPEMRLAAEEHLWRYPNFVSVPGRAEATTLADGSIDFITAAQAAHWFDPSQTRREFQRILKPGGWILLVWNERLTASNPFLAAYEQLLLAYGTDYESVRHERTQRDLDRFFRPSPVRQRSFELSQELDYQALEGRLLSSSYAPEPNHPRHRPMLRELARIFDRHQKDGKVQLDYRTRMYYGRMMGGVD